jgi:cobalt-precorrin 5A hydrolase
MTALKNKNRNKLALWVITPNGRRLAEKMVHALDGIDLFISGNAGGKTNDGFRFSSLGPAVEKQFHGYRGHIFIMSTGIVVRMISALIRTKTSDPAVVVVDEKAVHAISLLSGHIGGANRLTLEVARILGARPVITTATDVSKVPAIDVLALQKHLVIENPAAIKTVNMALLKKERLYLHDPFEILQTSLPNTVSGIPGNRDDSGLALKGAGVFIDDVIRELPQNVLVLRPASLVAGIGCNRDTGMEEIKALLDAVFTEHHLATASIKALASIDLKSDEPGLKALAEHLDRPLIFFTSEALNTVTGIERPSLVVEKHVGVKSVCEAAAILAAGGGKLIAPKQTNPNTTVAVARISYSSSESALEAPNT